MVILVNEGYKTNYCGLLNEIKIVGSKYLRFSLKKMRDLFVTKGPKRNYMERCVKEIVLFIKIFLY
jgi:hypothetical protein